MSHRRVQGTSLTALAVILTVTGCTQPVEEPKGSLRDSAPSRLVIGSSAAGGGHNANRNFPDPFSEDDEYRDLLATEFSSLTPENQLKWEYVHPSQDSYDFADADAIVDFAEENGQVVRGHTLLWHNQNPPWLTSGTFTDDELRGILHDHITTVVGHYAGRISQWDVANEIFDESGELRTAENLWLARFGPDIIAHAFRWAHEADPDAVLFLNDFDAEAANPKSDAYFSLAQQLLDEGVPLGGFGVQGHLSMRYSQPSGIEENLRRFADLGLAVAITEVDVRMVLDGDEPTEQQLSEQADRYRDLLRACLAVEKCTSFTLWSPPDSYSWVPFFFTGEGAATPWWDDYSRKPAYDALRELLSEAQ